MYSAFIAHKPCNTLNFRACTIGIFNFLSSSNKQKSRRKRKRQRQRGIDNTCQYLAPNYNLLHSWESLNLEFDHRRGIMKQVYSSNPCQSFSTSLWLFSSLFMLPDRWQFNLKWTSASTETWSIFFPTCTLSPLHFVDQQENHLTISTSLAFHLKHTNHYQKSKHRHQLYLLVNRLPTD